MAMARKCETEVTPKTFTVVRICTSVIYSSQEKIILYTQHSIFQNVSAPAFCSEAECSTQSPES
jgi:hypothetical protein